MAYYNFGVFVCIFLIICIILQSAHSQKCVEGVQKLDIALRAYNAPVVIRAKVTIPAKQNQTAKVTSIFGTKSGGLSSGDTIIFGPVKKGKGCKIRKNSEYILFLESNMPGSNFFRIKYDPVSKMREAKKLKKILCAGCVKPPKFKQSDREVKVEEDKSFTFNCKVSGNPRPMAVFLKDSKVLPLKSKGMKIKIKKKGGGGKLKINRVDSSHAGIYTCRASNFAGNASLSYTLTVKDDNISTTAGTATTITASPTSPEICIPCGESHVDTYCLHGGRCCSIPETDETYCRCSPNYFGPRCGNKILNYFDPRKAVEARYHRQTVAIMGVCIALLLVILICYIVYCKFKKSRSHILKDIQKQYCPVIGRDADREEERPIANANRAGIVADDSNDTEAPLTGYRSTNFQNESPYDRKFAFTQRPQTYDDVIPVMDGASAESRPLVAHKQQSAYVNRDDSGRRKRKNGVAVENRVGYGRKSVTASDGDMSSKGARRIDELKRNRDSIISTTSSVGSHPELRKPAIPIDERLATMNVHIPPAYGDIPDSSGRHDRVSSLHSTDQASPHSTIDELNSLSQTDDHNKDHGVSSRSSDARLTELDSEVQAEGGSSNYHPLTPPGSAGFSPDYLPKSDYIPKSGQSTHSQEIGSGHISPRSKLPYKENIQSPPYPYYEPNAEKQLHSPSAYRRDNENSPLRADHVGPSAQYYDSPRGSQPSSPRQYQNNCGMGMPYHHAPVTVASALTHALPLLTKEKSDVGLPYESQNRPFLGSAMSLTSSSADESGEQEGNRDSRRIEV